MKRYALITSLPLLIAAFIWSCQEQGPAPVISPEGSTTLAKKPGKGGGKGSAEDFDLSLTGGMLAVAQPVQAGKDNKRELSVGSGSFFVDVNLDAIGPCILNAPDLSPYKNHDGIQDPDLVRADIIAHLKAVLTFDGSGTARSFGVNVFKSAALDGLESHLNAIDIKKPLAGEPNLLESDGVTVKDPDDPVITSTRWGQNGAGTGNFGIFTTSTPDDINNPEATRIFTASEGTWRMVARLGSSGNDPLVVMRCFVTGGETITITVAPVTP